MRIELLEQMLDAIGARIEAIGEDIQESKFGGLSQRLEQLRKLIDSAEAVERMKNL